MDDYTEHRRSSRFHFIHVIWSFYWLTHWSWVPAITDDFGDLVRINSTQTNYSFWGQYGAATLE